MNSDEFTFAHNVTMIQEIFIGRLLLTVSLLLFCGRHSKLLHRMLLLLMVSSRHWNLIERKYRRLFVVVRTC